MARALATAPGARSEIIAEVGSLGRQDMVAVASMTGAAAMRGSLQLVALVTEGSVVRDIETLRRLGDRLAGLVGGGGAAPGRRLLGLLPPEDPARILNRRWDDIQRHFAAALATLAEARQSLASNRAAVAQEELALATQVEALRRHVHLAARIEGRFAATGAPDPDLLVAVRQRRRDLLAQLAVAQQGVMALRMLGDQGSQVLQAIEVAMTTTTGAVSTTRLVLHALATRRALDEAQAMRAAWAGVRVALATVEERRARALRIYNAAHVDAAPGP